jgi:uncharacterized small protein (DUF1192 family)
MNDAGGRSMGTTGSAREGVMFEDEPKKPKAAFIPGQDVSLFSVDDLRETVDLLKGEIARLEAAIAAKQGVKASAESLFKF